MRTTLTSDAVSAPLTPPCLTVALPNQASKSIPLQEGGSVFAGSAATCGIQIVGENIAQYHCMFSLTQGRIWVQHCQTGGELFVNGQAIENETVLNHGDEITVGAHRIMAILDLTNPAAAKSLAAAAIASTVAPCTAPTGSPSEAHAACEPATNGSASPIDHDPSLDAQTRDYLDQLIHELSEETDPSTSDAPPAPTEAAFVPVGPADEIGYQTVDFREEENDLLREEIAHLQRELSERDAELESYRRQTQADGADPFDSRLASTGTTPADDENVLRLVQRLEELLDELQKSDGRISALEELLRASEEAKQAEQDEREQLESWVGEIEQRLALREAEMEAEVDRLKSRNQELQAQLQLSDTQARSIVKTVAAPTALPQKAQEVVQGLRDRCEELARRAQAAEADNGRLQDELKAQTAAAAESLQTMEKKLVEQELEFSRERAEIARGRAELERARDDLERDFHDGDLNETDTKFAAMRQHLRELHEQESRAREERKQRSLSGRIASLLTRVGQR